MNLGLPEDGPDEGSVVVVAPVVLLANALRKEGAAHLLPHLEKAAGYLDHVVTVLSELSEALDPEVLPQTATVAGFEMSVVQQLGYLLERVGGEAVVRYLLRPGLKYEQVDGVRLVSERFVSQL